MDSQKKWENVILKENDDDATRRFMLCLQKKTRIKRNKYKKKTKIFIKENKI